MGNTDSKLNFRKAVIQLTTKTQVCALAFSEECFSERVFVFVFPDGDCVDQTAATSYIYITYTHLK